ncbi:DUF262 domain-containing protein [Bdellovibrio sp. BCCA]|uniref:DUF262 domain-containing protein n=1 Tax=Bdellovibrio sp. BCCA TaxID=3136281 RepID=UPI0030F0589B
MSKNKESNFRPDESRRVSMGVRSFSDICNSGLDFNASYQRGDVWDMENRVKFLDAIFAEIDTGSVLLAEIPAEVSVKTGIDYEVVDGKQRLSTIQDYLKDQFEYRGYKFSELSRQDQIFLRRSTVRVGVLPEDSTKKERAQAFLATNDTGVPQSREHLNMVRKMVEEMD